MENENNIEQTPVITESTIPAGETAVPTAELSANHSAVQQSSAVMTEEARAYAEQTAAVERMQAELDEQNRRMDEQNQKLLDALDEVLEKRTQEMRERQKNSRNKAERVAATIVKKGVGFVSLGLIMIFLGIVMIVCLFSPAPDFMIPLKLSPICAVLVGVELLMNQLMTRGHFRINIPSLVISAVLVVGCCIMCVNLSGTYKEDKQEYNNRTIAAEIYDRSYKELRYVADIADITVEVDLNPDGSGQAKGVDALSTDDHVNITVEFAGAYNSPKAFAADCKKILDGYRIMGISVTNFYFKNSGEFHSFELAVEGRYAQDQSESKLAEAVNYVYLDDADYLEDLEDYTEETKETSQAET